MITKCCTRYSGNVRRLRLVDRPILSSRKFSEESKSEPRISSETSDYELPFSHTKGRWLTLEQTLPRLESYRSRTTATKRFQRQYLLLMGTLVSLFLYIMFPSAEDRAIARKGWEDYKSGNLQLTPPSQNNSKD